MTSSGAPRAFWRGQRMSRALVPELEQIGFSDVVLRQHDVEWPVEHFATRCYCRITCSPGNDCSGPLMLVFGDGVT